MDEFSKLDEGTEVTEVQTATSGKDAAKKALLAKMNDAMQETLANDPTYTSRANRLVGSIEVVKSLGWTDTGNIVQEVSKKDSPDGKHKVAPEGKIVGYIIKNIGNEDIPVRTEKFHKDPATGRYVGTPVDVTLKPGQTMCLSRVYMTMLAVQPEFSMSFANGSMRASSAKTSLQGGNLAEVLQSYYFAFSDSTLKVNDPSIKVQIGDKVTGETGVTWVVKPEYAEDFGFLENEKEKAPKKARAKGPDTKQKLANFLNTLIQKGAQ